MTVEAIEDSRLTGGTLTLDGVSFAKQMTAVTLSPSVEEEGDDVETLSGATIEADETTSWTLDMGAISDFNDPAGFIEFARSNAGSVVPFSWGPNAEGPTYSGSVKVRAVAIGGDVKARTTPDTSWPVIGDPAVNYPPVG